MAGHCFFFGYLLNFEQNLLNYLIKIILHKWCLHSLQFPIIHQKKYRFHY